MAAPALKSGDRLGSLLRATSTIAFAHFGV
jgi:hypothetical protein